MKIRHLIIAVVSMGLSACTTVMGPNGQPRQVMSPMGAAVVQTLVSAGIGAGTGALMNNSPGWATGMVASSAGSIGSQVANAFIPQANGQTPYQQPQYAGVGYSNGPGNGMQRGGPQPLYVRQPDGTFVQIQQ